MKKILKNVIASTNVMSAWQSRGKYNCKILQLCSTGSLRLLVMTGILFIGLSANAYVTHEHNEYSYQKAWAEKHNAIMEYKLDDYTRVDCLTPTHAIEFDFAIKWAEAVGQALYYSLKTGKKPMVILILENPQKEMFYFNRVKKLATKYNFEVQYVTKDILNLDEHGKCSNIKCRCHK